ncbi:hypothetical protein [uncultured Eudoraea sp.]|uniref:hypothetical protein n=1 Tax=uncultured Eudoraea sp. TaxID=1035614 RepID=UPI00261155F6|nr:hypothetical protein [uncultured Eudoraea sp.]
MKRRKFLLISIFALFLSLISLWYFKFKSATTKALSYPTDLSEICDRETLIQIGNTYMKLTNENDKRYLKELLAKDAGMMVNDLKNSLKSKVAEDFNTGNTILLDGWLLSITEARQCAFLCISEAN